MKNDGDSFGWWIDEDGKEEEDDGKEEEDEDDEERWGWDTFGNKEEEDSFFWDIFCPEELDRGKEVEGKELAGGIELDEGIELDKRIELEEDVLLISSCWSSDPLVSGVRIPNSFNCCWRISS